MYQFIKDGPLTPHEQQAMLFKALFDPDDLVELRHCHPKGDKRPQGQQKTLFRWLHAKDFNETHSKQIAEDNTTHNVYFGVNPRQEISYPKYEGGKDKDIIYTNSVIVDIDGGKVTPQQVYDACIKHRIKPTAIVESNQVKGGVHVYLRWVSIPKSVKTIAPDNDSDILRNKVYEVWCLRLQQVFASEGLLVDPKVRNLSRILRIPGSRNLGSTTKSYTDTPCTLWLCDPEAQYKPMDLDAILPQAPEISKPKQAPLFPIDDAKPTTDIIAAPNATQDGYDIHNDAALFTLAVNTVLAYTRAIPGDVDLFQVCANCSTHGFTKDEALVICSAANKMQGDPPLPEDELPKKVNDGFTYVKKPNVYLTIDARESQPNPTPERLASILKERIDLYLETEPIKDDATIISKIDGMTTAKPEKQPTQTDLLLGIVEKQCELFTSSNVAYASVRNDGHKETWKVRSSGFRLWLQGQYYAATKKGVRLGHALDDALATVEAMAVVSKREMPVHMRIGGQEDRIYLDLCDPLWRVVEVTRDGWKVLSESPIHFIRTQGNLALPEPVHGGSVEDLRALVNCPDDIAWHCVLAWLIGCFNPNGSYPILAVNGEQGSAKTTLSRMLRQTIDPNRVELRLSTPRDDRDVFIAASGSRIYALDNVSGFKSDISDLLCGIATGIGNSTRRLYSDGDEEFWTVKRPILLNGIAELGSRSDFLDRCLSITIPRIPDESRREEEEIWRTFAEKHPSILGALLDAVSCALKNKDAVKLSYKPRMLDHARFAVAAESALGLEEGMMIEAIKTAREQANETAIDHSPIAPYLCALADAREGGWHGKANDLLREMKAEAAIGPKDRLPMGWPETPIGMRYALRRLAPNLARIGVIVTFSERKHDGTQISIVRQKEEEKEEPKESLDRMAKVFTIDPKPIDDFWAKEEAELEEDSKKRQAKIDELNARKREAFEQLNDLNAQYPPKEGDKPAFMTSEEYKKYIEKLETDVKYREEHQGKKTGFDVL